MSRVNTIAQEGVNILSGSVTAEMTADGPLQLDSYTVAGLPTAVGATGSIVYVSNGNAGSPCLGVSNGTNWLRIALGAAVAAS